MCLPWHYQPAGFLFISCCTGALWDTRAARMRADVSWTRRNVWPLYGNRWLYTLQFMHRNLHAKFIWMQHKLFEMIKWINKYLFLHEDCMYGFRKQPEERPVWYWFGLLSQTRPSENEHIKTPSGHACTSTQVNTCTKTYCKCMSA